MKKVLLFIAALAAFTVAVEIATAPPAQACYEECAPFYCGGGPYVWQKLQGVGVDYAVHVSSPIYCSRNGQTGYLVCSEYPCSFEGTGKLFIGGQESMEFSVQRKQQDQVDAFTQSETFKTLSGAEIKNRLLGMGVKFVRNVPVPADGN